MSQPELSFQHLTQRLRLRELPVGEPSPDLWQRIADTHAGRVRRARMRRGIAGSSLAALVLIAVLVVPKWLAPAATERGVDWQARAQALELQLRALRDGTGAHDDAGAVEAQSEIARVDDALQTAYDTGAERDQLEVLWKRRSELLGALISVRQHHVEISRI
ncbi:MAG TPA: hypothetical protein VLC97_11725 [Rhodanobacteraceae bacterium]|nr:hypothetical protein [Rhodanobacteraceae bacterium]